MIIALSTKYRTIDQHATDKALSCTPVEHVKSALKLLKTIKSVKPAHTPLVEHAIPLQDIIHSGFTIKDLGRALKVIDITYKLLMITKNSKTDLEKYGLLKATKSTGKMEVKNSVLCYSKNFPIEDLINSLTKSKNRKTNTSDSGKTILRMNSKTRHIWLPDNRTIVVTLTDRQMNLLVFLIKNEPRSTREIREHFEYTLGLADNFDIKGAKRAINNNCSKTLELDEDLIRGEKTSGYTLNTAKYLFKIG